VRKLLYNLRIRRRLLLSLISLGAIGAFVFVLKSGALDNTIRRRLSRMIKNKDAELQELVAEAESSSRNGKHREAIGKYFTALTNNPSKQRRHRFSAFKQQARIGLSQSLAAIGKHGRARDVAMTVAQQEPEYWYAYKNIGRILEDGGKADKAVEFYRSALQINPTDLDTVSTLIDIFEEAGQREEVVALCRGYLQSYALGNLKVWLDDTLVHECRVLVNGRRQRICIPYPGNGSLRLEATLDEQPLEVWLSQVAPRTHDPMSLLFLETGPTTETDIVQLRIGPQPTIATTTNLTFGADAKYLSFELQVSKPWATELTKKLRKAVTGNPR